MRTAHGRAVVAALAGLALGARPAGAQGVAPNRAAAYLAPTDVTDARAVWVNPGGLALRQEASVTLDLTVVQPGGRGRLGQVTAGFSARGLSFCYQRDDFANGLHGYTYRLGLGGASGSFGAGLALAFYRGATGGKGWDIGARYDWRPQVTVGGVIRNLGQPTVRGFRQDVTFVPAVTVRPLAVLLALSVQGAYTTSAALGYGLQASVDVPGRLGLAAVARLDTDRSLRRTALSFGFSFGRRDRVGLVGSTPGDVSRLDALSVYGVSSRTGKR